MDAQTLEYMGTRVDRARALTEKIQDMHEHIRHTQNSYIRNVGLRLTREGGSYSQYQLPSPICESENVKEAILKVLIEARDALQAELDAI